jgi:hypothetical protein
MLFLSTALIVCSAVAQTRNPAPSGWEYVRTIDSDNIITFHASGDTLFLNGLYSTNGGTSWDTLWAPMWDTVPHFLSTYFFYPHSAALWGVSGSTKIKNGIAYVRTNGTMNWEEYPFDSTTSASIGSPYNGFVNPFDDNDLFLLSDEAGQQTRLVGIWRSRNGGRSWNRMLNIPLPDAGIGAVYDLLFDERAAGQWYLSVESGYMPQAPNYYETTDNGVTFERMNYWGRYAGISAPGILRDWWTTSYQNVVGVVDRGQGVTDSAKFTNWLTAMDPTLPMSNTDSGYHHTLEVDPYAHFDSQPEHAFVPEYAVTWSTADSIVTRYYSHVYETTNDGETWTSLWSLIDMPLPYRCFLDQQSRTLWVLAIDNMPYKWPGYVARTQKRLFRYALPTDVAQEPARAIPTGIEVTSLFPLPVRNSLNMSFTMHHDAPIRVAFYDILGSKVRDVYIGTGHSGQNVLYWNVPAYVHLGTYSLRFESGSHVLSRTVVVFR